LKRHSCLAHQLSKQYFNNTSSSVGHGMGIKQIIYAKFLHSPVNHIFVIFFIFAHNLILNKQPVCTMQSGSYFDCFRDNSRSFFSGDGSQNSKINLLMTDRNWSMALLFVRVVSSDVSERCGVKSDAARKHVGAQSIATFPFIFVTWLRFCFVRVIFLPLDNDNTKSICSVFAWLKNIINRNIWINLNYIYFCQRYLKQNLLSNVNVELN